mgnify:CR=1 FL=1
MRAGQTAPDEPPLDLDNPLDLRHPTPTFRVAGRPARVPAVAPTPTARAGDQSVAFYQPESVAADRGAFITQLVQEDADIRSLAVALRLRGYSRQVIAQGLGVDVARVSRVLKQARSEGTLTDVLADLTTEALPLAMEKLIEAIDEGKDWAIRDTLKGGGIFRRYTQQASETTIESRTLDVRLVMPATAVAMNPRGIVGAPRTVEVLDATPVADAPPAAGPLEDGDRTPEERPPVGGPPDPG